MSRPITVVGSLNADLVVTCPELPRPGQTVVGTGLHRFPGGKGGNQAVAASRLGGRVRHIGCVGEDEAGAWLVGKLRADGVEVDGISVTSAAPTGLAIIAVDRRGENAIVVVPGANGECRPAQVEAALAGLAGRKDPASQDRDEPGILLLQLEVPLPTVASAARVGRALGFTVLLNPAPAAPLPEELLADCDFLIPNATEAAVLSGQAVETVEEALEAAEAMRAGRDLRVIVTLGERGAVYAGPEGPLVQPPWPVQAVDATGAGDAFVAAFAVALADGTPLEEALSLAAAVGALTATKLGAQSSFPSSAGLAAFLAGRPRP